MSIVNNSRFTALKSRVKAECARRCKTGSVASYAGIAYNYTITPAIDKISLTEHRNKLVEPLNAINSTKVLSTVGEVIISEKDLANMEAFITILEARNITDAYGTDCSAGCTGACYSCVSSCTGCSGCGYDCGNGCYTTCSVVCGYSGCVGSCLGGCGTDCSTGCGITCGTCGANCMGVSL